LYVPGAVEAAGGGLLKRLSAEFLQWNGGEISTNATSGVLGFYTKTVSVPENDNVLYVTLAATGDVHNEAKMSIRCQVDGVDCNSGSGGWVVLQKNTHDEHDNAVNYTWCKETTSGAHTVTLDLASDGGQVYLEKIHVFIDSNRIPSGLNRCHRADD